jgi:hypothetical protein
MRDNKNQQLKLFEENIECPAELVQAIDDLKLAVLKCRYEGRKPKYNYYLKGGIK